MRSILTLTIALLLPMAAESQRLDPVGARAETAPRDAQPTRRTASSNQLPIRVLLGVGSAFGGAFAGAFAGLAVPAADCNCDDPGLREAVYGAMVGAIVVPALVSALPSMGSECSFAKRAGFGLIGGVVGAAFGGVAGAAIDRGAGVPVGYVGGAGLGAALGSGLCRS